MPDFANVPGQARGLSVIPKDRATRVLAISSGKGGVGKTSMAVNLATLFADRGYSVMLVDGDLGLANADVHFGLKPRYDLQHFLNGEKSLEDIIVTAESGVRLVPAATGVQGMALLSVQQQSLIIQAFSKLKKVPDLLIVDTAAGLAESVMTFCHAAQEVMIVLNDEPAALTDAYGLIKLLSRDYGVERFQLLANMVSSGDQGLRLYEKFSRIVEEFLDCSPAYLGHVPHDPLVKESIVRRQVLVHMFPACSASNALRQVADRIEALPHRENDGHLQFFLEQRLARQSSTAGMMA